MTPLGPDPVKVEARDERTLTLTFPVSGDDLSRASAVLAEAGRDGYVLDGGSAIMGGGQRDPYPIGFKLIMRRAVPTP